MLRKVLFASAIVVLAAVLCGCPATVPPPDDSPTVTLVVTHDFGQELLLEQSVEIEPDTSALDALKMVAKVETKYGGGFVSAINGLSSEYANGNNKDWFFYINGVSSHLGAADYTLRDGDTEHWDFRDWSYHQFVPAVIGDFPRPFLSGYQDKLKPTVVVCAEPFGMEAQELVTILEQAGVTDVSIFHHTNLTDIMRAQANLIIIGAATNPLIKELNGQHKKLGFYAFFQDSRLTALDARGEVQNEHGQGTGLIQATQNPWSPNGIGAGDSVVLMVTGTDDIGVSRAIGLITDDYDEISYAFAVIVTTKGVIKIPQ